MALFTEGSIRARAQREMQRGTNLYKSKGQVLKESVAAFKATLEDLGYSVYVDWVDDAQLDRSKVNEATAELLRERMNASKSLFYVTKENAETSKWMPWECGYFDGIKEKVAILPVKQYSFNDGYLGQEYLSLYPYCVKGNNTHGKERLWIHKDKEYYLAYEIWLETKRDSIKWKKIG